LPIEVRMVKEANTLCSNPAGAASPERQATDGGGIHSKD
jgi:hypothetical protein